METGGRDGRRDTDVDTHNIQFRMQDSVCGMRSVASKYMHDAKEETSPGGVGVETHAKIRLRHGCANQ